MFFILYYILPFQKKMKREKDLNIFSDTFSHFITHSKNATQYKHLFDYSLFLDQI